MCHISFLFTSLFLKTTKWSFCEKHNCLCFRYVNKVVVTLVFLWSHPSPGAMLLSLSLFFLMRIFLEHKQSMERKQNPKWSEQWVQTSSLGELGHKECHLCPYKCFHLFFVPCRVKARDPSLSGYTPRGRCWPERQNSWRSKFPPRKYEHVSPGVWASGK